MKKKILLNFSLLGLVASAAAQTASTTPAGLVNVTVPAKSDAVLAVPLYRGAVFKGKIQDIQAGPDSATFVVTAAGASGWQTSQFVQSLPSRKDAFAVLIATGAKEGMIAKVTANSAATLTVELPAGENLDGVKTNAADGEGQGDEIDVLPYWSLASLFKTPLLPDTQVLQMPASQAGLDLAAETVSVFSGANWRRPGQGTGQLPLPQSPTPVGQPPVAGLPGGGAPPAAVSVANGSSANGTVDHLPLPFGAAFILRNNGNIPQTISLVGSVPMAKHRRFVRTLAPDVSQDNWIGLASPVPEALGTLNLGFSSGDQLLVFDNSATGFNKTASEVLAFDGAAWKNSGGQAVDETFFFQPGFGYVLRKNSTGAPANFVWQVLQSYLAGVTD